MRRSLPLGLEWTSPSFSSDKWVLHSHASAPPCVLVKPKDPLEKINERLYCIDLTLKHHKTLDPSLLLLGLCQLFLLFLTQEYSLQVIQRVEFNVLLREIQPNPRGDLKFLKRFEPEVASLRIVHEEFVSLLRLNYEMLRDGSEHFCDALEHVIL